MLRRSVILEDDSGGPGRRGVFQAMAKDLLSVVKATKYPLEAFQFIEQGLAFTVKRIHGEPPKKGKQAKEAKEQPPQNRHISGKALCHGLRDYAVEQYGAMARTVLRHWRITSCEDFGHIVFAMVDAGMMNKTDDDSIRDFVGVFSFDEAFSETVQLSESN